MLAICGPKTHTTKRPLPSHPPSSEPLRTVSTNTVPPFKIPGFHPQPSSGLPTFQPRVRVADIALRLEAQHPDASTEEIYQWTGEELRRVQEQRKPLATPYDTQSFISASNSIDMERNIPSNLPEHTQPTEPIFGRRDPIQIAPRPLEIGLPASAQRAQK